MSKLTLKQLKLQYDHVTYYNEMSPFPIYDTEYVEKLKEKMDEITESQEDYDKVPVEACKHCKSLHIVVDDVDNSICMKCNSINEIEVYPTIQDYLKNKNIWND